MIFLTYFKCKCVASKFTLAFGTEEKGLYECRNCKAKHDIRLEEHRQRAISNEDWEALTGRPVGQTRPMS